MLKRYVTPPVRPLTARGESSSTVTVMRPLVALLAIAGATLLSCEKPPQTAIDAANSAFDAAARNPDVVTYAPDSLRKAQEGLAALSQEVEAQAKRPAIARRYQQAQDMAGEVSRASDQAVADAARIKEQTKSDADALLSALPTAIAVYESKLWSAQRVRGVKLSTDAAALGSTARASLADAQADLSGGAYAAAKARAVAIQQQLSEGGSQIAEAVLLAKGM